MGPHCSSAETQVCHRSYIIAARLNQILRRQTSRSHYGSKVPAVTITVFKYRNKIGKAVVKAVPEVIPETHPAH